MVSLPQTGFFKLKTEFKYNQNDDSVNNSFPPISVSIFLSDIKTKCFVEIQLSLNTVMGEGVTGELGKSFFLDRIS